jgi:hypothetical protein
MIRSMHTPRGLASAAAAALLLAASAQLSVAAVHVPGDVSTVDGALFVAARGDTVLVAPGTYYVNLEWPATDGITLASELGALSTILDGRDIVQVIGIYTGVDTTTVVRGFTIRDGHAEGQ